MPACFHEPAPTQVGQVFRCGHLAQTEDVLKVADAEGGLREKMHHAKPGFVAEAVINLDESGLRHTFNGNMPEKVCRSIKDMS